MLLVTETESQEDKIALMQGFRALMGAGAVMVPLGFVIAIDLAPPKNRGIVTVMVNIGSQLGSLLASAVSIYFGSGPPFNTRSFTNGSEEYNRRSAASYNAAMYCSLASFLI